MPDLGSIKTQFNRAYIYLNPKESTGPSAWRLSNLQPINSLNPEGNNLKDIYALLPINKKEGVSTTNLFFDIVSLPTTNNVSTKKNYLTSVLSTFLANVDDLPRLANFSIVGLKGVDPIKTIVNQNVGIVYFDMSDLPTLKDVSRFKKYNISTSTFKYNSRSVDVLTATEPLETQLANQTATVSIDFRNLPEA